LRGEPVTGACQKLFYYFMEIAMNLKTVLAFAVAAAFAAPLAAQTSSGADKTTGGSNAADRPANTAQPGPLNPSTGPAVTSGSNAADRPAGEPKSGAAGSSSAPASSAPASGAAATGSTAAGGFAALDKNNDGYISRDEARDAPWNTRFSELDKDNDGRLSRSEFDAMQAGTGATGSGSSPSTTGGMGGSVGPSTSGIGDKPGQKQ
jgi:hypothetical protein